MKKLNYPLALSIVLVTLSANVKAQDKNFDNHSIAITIPEVAIVDIEPAASKTLHWHLLLLRKRDYHLTHQVPIAHFGLIIPL